MFFIRNGHTAVLLLTLTQSFVLASLDSEKNESKASIETVARYLGLPWMEGLERLAHSSEYPDGEEVRAFMRGVESGDTWALQILDTLWEDQSKNKEKNTQLKELYNQRKRTNADIRDKRCTGFVRTDPEDTASDVSGECSDFPSADRDPTTSYKPQDDQIMNDAARSGPIESEDFTVQEICTITLFSAIGVFLLCCTICDFVRRNGPGKSSATVETLAKFSIYSNAVALLTIRTEPTGETMSAIHGIRCLGSFSVLFGHHYTTLLLVERQKHTLLEFVKGKISWLAMYIEMTPFAVDTFSVISGFLAAYLFFKFKQSGAKFNVLTMYLHRYLRLTPCLVVLLLLAVDFFPRCGNGPMWEASWTSMSGSCQEKWWISLLYLQNIVSSIPICLPYTWFLALDMQLFWLSPLILYPLSRSRKIGLRVLSFLVVVSMVTPAIVLTVNGYSNAILRFDRDIADQTKNALFYYFPTYNRATPYLIGIFLGYDVATTKRHLSRANVVINWLISGALAIFCAWATHRIYNSTFAYDLSMEIASTILLRPLWSVVIAWIIYACTQGYGGLAARFLSLPVFAPLSRLSYCIYLVHMVIQVIRITPSESPDTFLSSPLFNGVFGDLVLSIGAAFLMHLFIEKPSIVLTKMLIGDFRQPDPNTVDTAEGPKKNS